MGTKYFNKKDWVVLDGKFLSFVAFAPAIIYFLSNMLLDSPLLIKTVEGAVSFVPKLATDITFVSHHYSQNQANEFALFFANYCALSSIALVLAIGLRITKFRKHPYDFSDRVEKRIHYHSLVLTIGMVALIFFIPSFFIEPGEHSTFRYRPGYKAVAMSVLFLFNFGIIIYVSIVMWLTRHINQYLIK